MSNFINEENNINSKIDKNLENSNFPSSSSPEGTINIKSQKCLPSFLFENTEKDDYFNVQNSNDNDNENDNDNDNDSIDEKELYNIDIKNIMPDKEKENIIQEKKILDNNSENKIDIDNSDYLKNQKNNNERIIYNNGINYSNQNLYYSLPINNEKNIINNSFNNRNSNYFYQNYFNMSNNSNINSNILNNLSNTNNMNNNNLNINNNFMNQNLHLGPYSNSFGPIYPFNSMNFHQFFSPPIKQSNSNDNMNTYNYNYMNNNQNNNIQTNKKCFSFNLPFSQIQQNIENISSEKKKKKKTKKDKIKEDINNDICLTMKKLLNMTDCSLYNYLITQKGSRDVQTALKKI